MESYDIFPSTSLEPDCPKCGTDLYPPTPLRRYTPIPPLTESVPGRVCLICDDGYTLGPDGWLRTHARFEETQ